MLAVTLQHAFLFAFAVLSLFVTAFMPFPARAQENIDHWKFNPFENRANLDIVNTDEPTDNIGFPRFSCDRASGTILVETEMDLQARSELATLIRGDWPPRIQLIPADSKYLSLPQPDFSDGWHLKFEISAGAQAFADFKKTGIFRFKLGKMVVKTDLKAGIEDIGKFHDFCRAPPRSR